MAHGNGSNGMNLGGAHAPSTYHGAHFCPKCGYDGIMAVNLAMEFKAQSKQPVPLVTVHEPHLALAQGSNGYEQRGPGRPPGVKKKRARDLIADDLRAEMLAMKDAGKSPREISELTGRPVATIYGVLHRAKKEAEEAAAQATPPPPPPPAQPQEQAAPAVGTKRPLRRYNQTCPECKQGGFTPQGLGSHRRLMHGVLGTSETARKARSDVPLKPLAPREAEAKALFDAAKSNEEVQAAMKITPNSVKKLKQKLRRKLPDWSPASSKTTSTTTVHA